MEELIEKLSKGKSEILFLVGLSSLDSSSHRIVSHISQIQQCCPKVHVIFFQNHSNDNESDENDIFDSSSISNTDRVHLIDSNQSSTSPRLHDWLKMSKLIFLIDMFFSVSTSSGELSNTTHTILQYVSTCQSDIQIFCLHSVSMLYQNQNSIGNKTNKKKKVLDSSILSNNHTRNSHNNMDINKGITNLMNAFQDVSIIHMVRFAS